MQDSVKDSQFGTRDMLARDRSARTLGLTVLRDDPEHAVASMEVTEGMLNGFDVTQGGFVFALADTAFAIACNNDRDVTVSSGAEITFLKPTRLGQVLTATAELRAKRGRTGIYDVQVTDETGDVVAEFRGRSRTTTSVAKEPPA